MSVSSVQSSPVLQRTETTAAQRPEAKPDNDRDDVAPSKPSTQASASGMGRYVDKRV